MCRNHSHAVVTAGQGVELPDGSKVHIAKLAGQEFTLEFQPTGEKLTVPSATTLLLLSPGLIMPSYSPDLLMEVLSALCYVLGPNGEDSTIQIRA